MLSRFNALVRKDFACYESYGQRPKKRLAINKKKEFEKSLAELKNMFEITTNPEYLKDFASRIASVKTSIKDQATRLDQLK